MTIILSIVLGLAISTSSAFAEQPNQNVQLIMEKNEMWQSAQELSAIADGQLNNLADTYLLVGSTYKNSGDYKIAQENYTKAIELAKNAKNMEILLFANVGLVEARFLSSEIDETKKNTLLKQLKTDYKTSGGTLFINQCPYTCSLSPGLSAYKRNGRFICC